MTEPLLTGTLLFGNQANFEQLKEQIQSQTSRPPVISYLLSRSFEEHQSTLQLLDQHRASQNEDYLHWALVNLSFCISYWTFARFYNAGQNREPVTISELEKTDQPPLLSDIRTYLRAVKNGNAHLDREEVLRLLQEYQHMLAGVSPRHRSS